MRKYAKFIVFAIIINIFWISFGGCAQPTNGNSNDAITSVIYQNIEAANQEDIARYMALLHPQSPAYATTETTLRSLNDMYDLSYELSDLKVISSSDTSARVSFKLITRKISGPAFQDNELIGIFILEKYNKEWKIYNQEIQTINMI